MSQYPRRVLVDKTVTWEGEKFYVRHGSLVDVVPGSALEAAYGVSNLSGVLNLAGAGDPANIDKAAVSN